MNKNKYSGSQRLFTDTFRDILVQVFAGIVIAAISSIATAMSISIDLNEACNNTKKCQIYLETKDGKVIQLSYEYVQLESSQEDKSDELPYLKISPVRIINGVIDLYKQPEINAVRVKVAPEQLVALAPITETQPSTFFVHELEEQKITYADQEERIPIVKDWLENQNSGYPQLEQSLKEVLENRQGIGNSVPLTNIYSNYVEDTSNPPLTYDLERLKQSYVEAWREKNSGSDLTEFEEIAPMK